MTLQAQTQDPSTLITIDQLSSVLGRMSAGNEQIAGAIKLVGGLLSAAITIYSAATVFQTVMGNRKPNATQDMVGFSKLDAANMTKLHGWLDTYFDTDELMDICFGFDLDYEDLSGAGQSGKARELVEFCARRKMLKQLENTVLAQRPHLAESRIGA